MCCFASARGSVARSYCGFVRDRGTVRTSATSSISLASSRAMNSSTGRVECPIVKNASACAFAATLARRSVQSEVDPGRLAVLHALRVEARGDQKHPFGRDVLAVDETGADYLRTAVRERPQVLVAHLDVGE